jgi:hypothetical protein
LELLAVDIHVGAGRDAPAALTGNWPGGLNAATPLLFA